MRHPLCFLLFLPIAALLAHCLVPASHTRDECQLGDPSSCHDNAVRECHAVQEVEATVQNRWIDESCVATSHCVDLGGPHCVPDKCATDSDCHDKGVCRSGLCAPYFGGSTECVGDPTRCPPGTVCATWWSAEVDGGTRISCDGGACYCASE